MGRSNYAAKATESSTKAKADLWLNIYYRNSAEGSKRVSLGGLPLTIAESTLHKNLIGKLADMPAEAVKEFALKVFAGCEFVVTHPTSAADAPTEFDFDQF